MGRYNSASCPPGPDSILDTICDPSSQVVSAVSFLADHSMVLTIWQGSDFAFWSPTNQYTTYVVEGDYEEVLGEYGTREAAEAAFSSFSA